MAPESLAMLHSTCCRPLTISAPLRRRRTLAGEQNIYINTGSARLLLVWPSILELSTDGTSTPGLDSRRLQAAVEDSFIYVDVWLWISSPRAPMWRNCACWNVCLLTYQTVCSEVYTGSADGVHDCRRGSRRAAGGGTWPVLGRATSPAALHTGHPADTPRRLHGHGRQHRVSLASASAQLHYD